jgi:hypothetical protein
MQAGRRRLVQGESICDKQGIQFRGDVLDKPLRSDEFGALAKLMVRLEIYFCHTFP